MNRHTFKDIIGSKRAALANDIEDDDDEDRDVNTLRTNIEGEEVEGDDKVSRLLIIAYNFFI